MSFVTYNPTAVRFESLSEADDQEQLSAATTNVSLEQIADGLLWVTGRAVNSVNSVLLGDEGQSAHSTVFNTTSYVVDTDLDLELTGVAVGDWIEVFCDGYVEVTGAGEGRVAVRIDYDGVFEYSQTTYLVRAGMAGTFSFGMGFELPAPVGSWTSGILNVRFAGKADSGSSIEVQGPIRMSARQVTR